MHASIPIMRFCRIKGLIVADLSVDGFQKSGYSLKMDLLGQCQNQRVRRLPNAKGEPLLVRSSFVKGELIYRLKFSI
jgi:hypothetical protein